MELNVLRPFVMMRTSNSNNIRSGLSISSISELTFSDASGEEEDSYVLGYKEPIVNLSSPQANEIGKSLSNNDSGHNKTPAGAPTTQGSTPAPVDANAVIPKSQTCNDARTTVTAATSGEAESSCDRSIEDSRRTEEDDLERHQQESRKLGDNFQSKNEDVPAFHSTVAAPSNGGYVHPPSSSITLNEVCESHLEASGLEKVDNAEWNPPDKERELNNEAHSSSPQGGTEQPLQGQIYELNSFSSAVDMRSDDSSVTKSLESCLDLAEPPPVHDRLIKDDAGELPFEQGPYSATAIELEHCLQPALDSATVITSGEPERTITTDDMPCAINYFAKGREQTEANEPSLQRVSHINSKVHSSGSSLEENMSRRIAPETSVMGQAFNDRNMEPFGGDHLEGAIDHAMIDHVSLPPSQQESFHNSVIEEPHRIPYRYSQYDGASQNPQRQIVPNSRVYNSSGPFEESRMVHRAMPPTNAQVWHHEDSKAGVTKASVEHPEMDNVYRVRENPLIRYLTMELEQYKLANSMLESSVADLWDKNNALTWDRYRLNNTLPDMSSTFGLYGTTEHHRDTIPDRAVSISTNPGRFGPEQTNTPIDIGQLPIDTDKRQPYVDHIPIQRKVNFSGFPSSVENNRRVISKILARSNSLHAIMISNVGTELQAPLFLNVLAPRDSHSNRVVLGHEIGLFKISNVDHAEQDMYRADYKRTKGHISNEQQRRGNVRSVLNSVVDCIGLPRSNNSDTGRDLMNHNEDWWLQQSNSLVQLRYMYNVVPRNGTLTVSEGNYLSGCKIASLRNGQHERLYCVESTKKLNKYDLQEVPKFNFIVTTNLRKQLKKTTRNCRDNLNLLNSRTGQCLSVDLLTHELRFEERARLSHSKYVVPAYIKIIPLYKLLMDGSILDKT